MTTPSQWPQQRRLVPALAVWMLIAFASTGVMTKAGRFESEPSGVRDPREGIQSGVKDAGGLSESSATPKVTPAPTPGPMSQTARRNPTYPAAPAPGSTYFRTLSFAELDNDDNSTPGTRAARELLVRTNKGDAAAAEGQYNGSAKNGFDEYQRAVFLNTVADICQRDNRLLENATFVRFYDGKKKLRLEYGIILSGITAEKLDQSKMGLAGLLSFMGRRSPRMDAVASLEATPELEGTNLLFAFDVDLYNPKSDADKHSAEVDFNRDNSAATHPADVARALELRGILSGVTTK